MNRFGLLLKREYWENRGGFLWAPVWTSVVILAMTIIGIFVLRYKRPNAERPYKAFGYPIVPALYCVGAAIILVVLFVYQTTATWPGLLIVLTGVPVYFIWSKLAGGELDAERS